LEDYFKLELSSIGKEIQDIVKNYLISEVNSTLRIEKLSEDSYMFHKN
jgi:hypothetical protein